MLSASWWIGRSAILGNSHQEGRSKCHHVSLRAAPFFGEAAVPNAKCQTTAARCPSRLVRPPGVPAHSPHSARHLDAMRCDENRCNNRCRPGLPFPHLQPLQPRQPDRKNPGVPPVKPLQTQNLWIPMVSYFIPLCLTRPHAEYTNYCVELIWFCWREDAWCK